jgi:hypothetical protein
MKLGARLELLAAIFWQRSCIFDFLTASKGNEALDGRRVGGTYVGGPAARRQKSRHSLAAQRRPRSASLVRRRKG